MNDKVDRTDEGSGSKPCRACTDFKSWMKKQMNHSNSNVGSHDTQEDKSSLTPTSVSTSTIKTSSQPHPLVDDCPLDKSELGVNTWSFLHTMAAYYPERPSRTQQTDMKSFIHLFSKFYPCEYCADDLKEDLKKHEPDVSSNTNLSQWFCELHNRVNLKLGKPVFDCKMVMQRWKDGWADGRCD